MMLRILTTLLVLSSALAAPSLTQTPLTAADNVELVDCGTDSDGFKLEKLEATPYPPRAGENVTVYAVGTVYQTIEEGAYVDLIVKLGVIKVTTQRVDVCQTVRENGGPECPIEKGQYVVNQTFTVPGVAPLGRYRIEARGYFGEDSLEVDLACVNLNARLLPVRPHFMISDL